MSGLSMDLWMVQEMVALDYSEASALEVESCKWSSFQGDYFAESQVKGCKGIKAGDSSSLTPPLKGYLWYEKLSDNVIEIKRVLVGSDVRRRGLASSLVKSLIKWGQGFPYGTYFIAKVPESNLKAQLLFKKLGFKAEVSENTSDLYTFRFRTPFLNGGLG